MTPRKFAGYLCVALGFGLILLLGYGVIGPIGASLAEAMSIGDVLVALMPSMLMAVAAFAIGLWLLRGKKK